MACVIRLKRMGGKKKPHFKIVVCDSKESVTGKAIEEVGIYDPSKQPALVRVDKDRVKYWMGVGAKPSETVLSLINKK
ncbi:MAG: 30S ribosomal protein S16 [Candidatus Omnitrophica bacterium]|nr:30S ribosomal protein S16 [Candidatus Omnitrophota bacterium]